MSWCFQFLCVTVGRVIVNFITATTCRESISGGIIADLSNYRHKRVLGLGSIYGDQYVTSEFVHFIVFTNAVLSSFFLPPPPPPPPPSSPLLYCTPADHMPISKQLDVVITLLTTDLKTCLDEKLAVNIRESLRKYVTIWWCMFVHVLSGVQYVHALCLPQVICLQV